ncbi:unnamed protein product [Dibothriocephalus latus]|uniref:PI3K/PI4K catalytic domain-containing protein n=1 Tax=Dibothriocephalus latus TaxID=60516 RepID=A0A3P6P6E3_DIBLA|nr:unnamed protein product [Dibothriocephalus latus]
MDALICHLMEVADSIWLSAGLDFRMVHFKVLPISPDCGVVELTCHACNSLSVSTHEDHQLSLQNMGVNWCTRPGLYRLQILSLVATIFGSKIFSRAQ